ncbi:MAG: HRDC domain-containing protein [Chthoniobacterales bacterium]|nr:HRDC domain-containing protein [Chthoniobacterales bacterium]
MITSDHQLAEILPELHAVERVAVDTEADSLHCYFEKLCLIQLTVGDKDYLVDPLSPVDLQPLCGVLAEKEIVLQGMDFDLRLLRRTLGFAAREVFDTVIAARLLGLREFSLAALVQQYFGVTLAKGSQKANWARRPLPPAMAEYAKNDTHFLLPLAAKMEAQLEERGRMRWFRQSCQRALELAAVQRERDPDQVWRLSGSGTLPAQTNAVLRALWHWRDQEAQLADRPAFHILQNSALLESAARFVAGEVPDYRHLTERRRRGFLSAAREALELPESEWPQRAVRPRLPRVRDLDKRVEELRRRRDQHATVLELDPSFIASRSALENIAADESRSDQLLVEWQRELLEV